MAENYRSIEKTCIFSDKIPFDKSLKLTKTYKKQLASIQKEVMKNVVFSRFKYYISQKMTRTRIPDSRYGIHKFREGNCVAFAYYTQYLLHKNGFKGAVVIGSAPPALFKRPGYHFISHAAVVLPYDRGYALFDAAFYYPRPVYISSNLRTGEYETDHLEVKNVYSGDNETWTFDYRDTNTNIDTDTNTSEFLSSKNLATISSTPYIRAHFSTGFSSDECRYYLRELKNADECVTVHTNHVDKRIFYCKVTPALDIELYYAFDLNNSSNPRMKGRYFNREIPSINVSSNMRREDIVKWIDSFGVTNPTDKRCMKSNILKFFDYYIKDNSSFTSELSRTKLNSSRLSSFV